MELTGEAGKIRLSEAVYRQSEENFELEARGLIEIKGKGQMPIWFQSGKKHCFLVPLISPLLFASSGFSGLAAAAFSMSRTA